jgi:hypothetical protein
MSKRDNCGVRRLVNFPVYNSLGIAIIEGPNWCEIRSATAVALVPQDGRVSLLVSTQGIEHLRWLRAMRADDLHAISFAGERGMTDYHIEYLAGMTALIELDLTDTLISDRSIFLLSSLTSLERLKLRGSCMSYAGTQKLKLALPQCTIQSDWGEPS